MEDGHDAGADASADDVEISAAAPKGRGRLRICKQCKFTCTDSIEFLQHQTKAHGEGEDSHPSKKAALKVAVIKKRTSRSESEISMDSMTSEKLNGEEVPFVTEMYDEPEHEDDRLIIAEENDPTDGQDPSSVTPTRCGNIQNRTYVCNVCEFTSTSAKTYLHHQKDDHKYDFTIYECDICEYATKYKQKLPRHRKLHFSGQEGMLLPNNTFEETPNNSLLNHSQEEDMSMIGEEDDDEIDEEEDDPVVTVIPQPVIEVPFIPEKKKKTRQEVDPAKYFEVVDDTGIKYACSSCGNVYKWRKSLNKHWKEKHGGEVPDGSKKPPGLMYLVNSGNHTMYGKRRIYSNSVLASMQQPSSAKSPSVSQSPSLVRAETPVSMGSLMNGPSPITSDYTETTSAQPVVFPKFIGPFVNNTTPSAYTPPTATSIQDYVSAHIQRQKEEVEGAKRPQSNSGSQEQPLDFSVRKDDNPTLDPSFFKVKMEPLWMGDEDPKASLTDESSKNNNAILQCTKCSFVAKTLVDYSSHMTLHLNRRAFKCAVCQEHFNGVEDLNKHFLDEHAEKIQEHKDAIQKIPHGLQQTYHLLKMPLDAITHLSSQDLSSTDSKQLKCNMCDFVAKWPAELQKHAVSHSEERPFMCMVCGSTYKWKWDLVKHFEKSHHTLPNPYKRRETLGGGANKSNNNDQSHTSADDSLLYTSTTDDLDDLAYMQRDGEPMSKRRRMSDSDMPELIPKPRDDDHIAVFDDSRDLGIGKNILEAPSLYAERPSSLPSKLDSYADPDHSNDDEHSTSSIKITNVQSLYDDEMDYLLYKHDADSMIQRPVTEETQKAIAATVRQRLNNLDSQKFLQTDMNSNNINSSCADILLPYKCPKCEYRARWPSEITQHMKNHSDEKPYHCPRCNYRSKWKWDVVKHLKRCGGGTIKDVIDTSRFMGSKRIAPPNVTVLPEGKLQQQTPQPVAYLVSSNNTDHTGGQGAVIVPIMAGQSQGAPPLISANQGNTPIQPKPVNTGSSHQVKQGNNSHSSKQPVFRSLINQGLYHCLECPFVGHSPAELKRHSVLHSENKPFTCGTCGYSSRWKCDLKKHMRTYNHFSSQVSRSPGLNGDDSGHTDSDEPDRPERQVFTCTKCPYATTKHHILETHMKIHGTPSSSSSSSPAKFKCKQCDFQVNDLSNFLQHRVTHSNQNAAASAQASPSPSDVQRHEEIDAARLKHPRKAMKRLQCSKCDFVCSKRETMEIHEAEHEKELNYKCFYCDMTVNDKESLLDHISTHTEFNPDEWETFFMEDDQSDEEDDHLPERTKFTVARSTPTDAVDVPSPPPLKMFHPNQQRANTIAQKDFHSIGPPQLHIPRSMQNSQQVMSSKSVCSPSSSHLSLISGNNGRSAGSISSIHSRNIPQQQTSKSNHVSGQGYEHSTLRNIQPAPAVTRKRFTCEWCEAMFAHVTTLYQHAKNVHPLELRKQELAEAARSSYQDSSSNHQSSQNQNPQRPQQRQQHQQQQQQQQLSHRPKPLHLVSSPQYNQPKQSLVSENKRQFLDTLRHILPNDSKQSNMHNTHVKSQGMTAENITSTLMRAKKSTSPQKKARSFQCTKCPFTAPNAVTYLRHVERHGSNCKHTCWFCDYSIDRLNLLYQHMKGSHSDKWKGSESEMQLPAGPAPTYPIIVEDDPHTMEKIRAELNFANNYQKNKKPVLILKEQMTWRGVPIQICSMDGKKSYKCPKCSYVNSNIANAANHVRQHGSNRKYQCKYCDYCSDNLKLIYQHMDKVHPKEPAFIEVTKNIEVGSADIDSDERENAEMEGEMDAEMEANMEENMLMSCPKCPFKAKLYDIYRAHVLMHTYNGQYKCEHCDYSVDDLGILTRHAVVHEEKDREKDGSLTPEKKHFTSMLNLKRVNDEAPLPAKSSPNKAAELATKLLTMQARQVLQKSRLSGRVRYRCSRCPYNTFCKNNIIKHRKQHIIKSRYKCPLCNYSASRAYLLQQHIKFHKTENNSPENSAEKSYQDIVLDPLDKSNKEYEKLQEEIEAEAESRPDGAGEEMEGEDDMEMEEEVTEEEPEGEEDEPEADVDMEEKTDGDNTGEEGENALSILSQHRSYRCKDCPFSSNSGTEFRKHCLLHGAAHRYKCDFCSYSLDRLNLLTQHRRLHADEPDFDPAPPPSALLNLDVLRLESEKHVEKVSSTLENSESAEPEPVEESESEPMRYSCPNCPFKSNALKSYNVHFQMHGIKKKYICDYCDWSIDRLNLLYQHRRVHTKQPGFNPSPDEINILNRDYALEAPGKFEAQIMGFNKHVENDNKSKETVEKKNLYNCKSCPFSTSNKNSFAYHKMLHRMRARYMCPECTYSVDRWNLLNQHLRLHQDTKKQQESEEHQQGQMKCPKCPYLSPSTEILESHLGMHGSENKFNCQFCDFSVETIIHLQQHVKVHEERSKSLMSPAKNGDHGSLYEPQSPDVVNPQLYFSSPDDTNLSEDSEEMELKCDRCPFSTTSKEELDRHDNQHNTPNCLPCCYCDFSCSAEEELQDHIEVHFPGTAVDKEVIKSIITKHQLEKNNNSLTEAPAVKEVAKSPTETSTPDSTVEEEQKTQKDSAEDSADARANLTSTSSRTKVYVCQYCEREFENKSLMMQHERQHLIGHQY
ncbi:uncharacterized protein LOC124121458 [Haliotis rufescens]|uniref:uncharacterized protein LOC124121458 n=1 Tax=Haliotis rufescens TaxID=6454 RepID=UPI001EB0883F|nr:uncharacterized protein LOC124121458 [Haliotis rufescens]XP_046340413.1 uncharacterized protein LOC124121458 [Haliotis rufescens]XP_046340414.1 uncharacterized protein LOC124121458 [Haliotis rufescens]XP_046340415.1 uncharacterized protein LOC124121458 [Haliotis rufescens]